MLSVDPSGCTLCWRHTYTRTRSLIILLVSCLAPVILHTAPNQMGCPPLAVSLNSLPVKAARKYVPDTRQALGILEGATGSGGEKLSQLQLWDFLQRRRDQRPNKAGLFKDKNYAREMNETYSMKCSSRILLLSELGVSNRAQMELETCTTDMIWIFFFLSAAAVRAHILSSVQTGWMKIDPGRLFSDFK